MRERKETPERMVVDGEIVEYGVFKQPFLEVNLIDSRFELGGRPAGRLARDLRIKEWEHFGIVHPDWYFGMVIFDAKFMSTSFFYAFDRKTGKFFEHARTGIGAPVRVARELWHGDCHFQHMGYQMQFENRLDAGVHRLSASIREKRGKPPVELDARVLEDLNRFEPLVVLSPLGGGRALYTHKTVCPVEGKVMLGPVEVELDPAVCVALIDVQKTHYPYRTFWKWATFGGHDKQGRLLGMNVCQNFIEDDEDYNENCTWVDGKIANVSAARFEFEECDVLRPWRVSTTGGELDVRFAPQGERHGRVSLGLVMSDFHQPFGEFQGEMLSADGSTVPVDGQFGLCEHHLARF